MEDRIELNGSHAEATPVRDAGRDPARREEVATGGRLLLGWGLILASVVLLALGWFGVSGTPSVAREMSYLVSGGIGGLLAGIIGVGLLVSNDVRRDRERLGRVESAMLELREMLVAQADVLRDLESRLPTAGDVPGENVPGENGASEPAGAAPARRRPERAGTGSRSRNPS